MICFDVYLNGEKLCRAGMKELVVMTAHVDYVESKFRDAENEKLTFSVGGLYDHPSGGQAHPHWIERTKLNEGDEVTLRIVDSDAADVPVSESISTREWIEEQERKYYESKKAKFESGENPSESGS